VPPRLYGGIERIVDMLARGLVERGHAVTLFAHPESASAGRLIPWPGRSSTSKADTMRNAARLAGEVLAGRFDLVHSFSRIAYLAPILPLKIPKLMTYQREVSPRSVRLGHAISRGSLEFSAISQWMTEDVRDLARWHMVPNGVPLESYTFCPSVAVDAPLVFLGRIEEIKGPHLAIEVARRTGSSLLIAGNIPPEHDQWFEKHIRPHLDDSQIRFIGPVDDRQKDIMLGSAKALLMPILWEEPFGIVMIEAMACGTPVIGLRRGAVPEVVEDGVSGFVRGDVEGLSEAVELIDKINRADCRSRVEHLYSSPPVVEGYLRTYHAILSATPPKV
jgi:glycosyltransferase involved in cell wall biosynthesis